MYHCCADACVGRAAITKAAAVAATTVARFPSAENVNISKNSFRSAGLQLDFGDQ
ncbi:hypothetical protein SBD_3137 [Streptomyces bottropensis ATCC 25435]|uniref:Uncharacterized protein n=1 Tax=Streptomyces bottropensis ATCC 25435 TaxID=1054862 RepID=M3FUC6_9ACTN|nr:hypothetical protein SBD_3137 [Streptomyces bottropensis ATCC 25435]